MTKCLNGGPCKWKNSACYCDAPLPGKMRLSCNAVTFEDMCELEKLALLLEHAPSLTVGDCSFEDFYEVASWLYERGVRVEDV